MSKPFYVNYTSVVVDNENLNKVGGYIVTDRQPKLKFPNKQAYNDYLRLNAEKIMARKRQHA